MTADERARQKWNRIYHQAGSDVPDPCTVLSDYSYLLPSTGNALDIACGLGGNALFLAASGLNTTAIDLSDIGVSKLSTHAANKSLAIETVIGTATVDYFLGCENYRAAFNVITVSNYLDRDLFRVIPELLAPDGLLFYQTFVKEKSSPEIGPSTPEFLLNTNELLKLTESLVCRVFYDLGAIGDLHQGLRNQSCLVAQKGE